MHSCHGIESKRGKRIKVPRLAIVERQSTQARYRRYTHMRRCEMWLTSLLVLHSSATCSHPVQANRGPAGDLSNITSANTSHYRSSSEIVGDLSNTTSANTSHYRSSSEIYRLEGASATDDCGTCRQWVSGSAYDGNDFLPKGAPCPDWWAELAVGECKSAPSQPALILDSKEACCTFCIEHNRRSLQPPCTHASFGPTSSGTENLCYVKSGIPPKLERNRLPRDSFLSGEPCPTYHPPRKLSWGGEFLLVLGISLVAYLVGGTRLGARRHPHYQLWKQFGGLTIDGWSFLRGGNNGAVQRSSSDDTQEDNLQSSLLPRASSMTTPSPPRTKQARRGPTTPLHHAAAIGNDAAVKQLLQADSGDCPMLDMGDKRCFSAFHIACAGGHVQIVRMLLAAGCDCNLGNDSGYSGWELAESLGRADVLALRTSRNQKVSGRRRTPKQAGREKAKTIAEDRRSDIAVVSAAVAVTAESTSASSTTVLL